LPRRAYNSADVAAALGLAHAEVTAGLGTLARVSLVDRFGEDLYELSVMAHRYARRAAPVERMVLRYELPNPVDPVDHEVRSCF
jgi:DNA-binding IclR family transcriptional regulator